MKAEDIPEIVKMTQTVDMACIVCGNPTKDRGLFVPKDSMKVGLGNPPPGKHRCILYPICTAHPKDGYTLTIIEEIIRNELSS